MASASLFGLIASSAAFFSAVCFSSFFLKGAHDAQVAYRAYSLGTEKKGFIAFVLRKGVVVLKPFAGVLLKNQKFRLLFEDIESLLEGKGYSSVALNITSLFCLVLLILFAFGLLVGGTVVLGLVLSFGGVAVVISWLNRYKEKRTEAIREEVPDALRSMGVCSQVGYSLQQTFSQVGHEVAEPLKTFFLRAAHDLDTGKTAEEALAGFREQIGISELSFVAVALDVQHKAGGSLRQVLDAARDSVESELELKRTLRIQTAQAKLSARIVSLMPFILIALFSFLSPGFLDPFFRSVEGFALLGLAVFMQVAGILSVRKLLDVAVD